MPEKDGRSNDDPTLVLDQQRAIREFAERYVGYVTKDKKRKPVHLIREQIRFVSDMFYGRTKRAIVWKSRGGGGSFAAALLVWICLVYRNISFMVMAGSAEQSKAVYIYTTQLWARFPELARAFLIEDPLATETRLKGGVLLRCVPTSEKQVRSKHVPGLALDESCILPGTFLTTDQGFRRVEEVQAGMSVLGLDGRFSQVTKAWSQQKSGQCVRVFPYYGPPAEVTGDHRVLVWRKETAVWVQAIEIQPTDYMLVPRWQRAPDTVRHISVKRYLGRNGKRTIEQPIPFSHSFFRWLGYWVGDGSVRRYGSNSVVQLHAGQAKTWFLDDYDACVLELFGRTTKRYSPPSRASSIDIHFDDKGLADWLTANIGKREDRHIPLWILDAATDEELGEFLKGYFRADGSTAKDSNGRVTGGRILTISPHLAQALFLACNRLGFPASVHHSIPNRYGVLCKETWGVGLNGKNLEAFGLEWGGEFTSKRARVDATWIRVPIRKLETFEYDGVVHDLTVANSHSFVGPYGTYHNCQEHDDVEPIMKAAINGAMSEDDHVIFLLSTFHHPTGVFADTWDAADDLGYVKYKWNAFETMARCTADVDCRTGCPLTWIEKHDNPDGTVSEEYVGCDGVARNGEGWATREQLIQIQQANRGSESFAVEWGNRRPRFKAQVYDHAKLDLALINQPPCLPPPPVSGLVDKDGRPIASTDPVTLVAGLDWGLASMMAIVLLALFEKRLWVVDVVTFAGVLEEAAIEQIRMWQQMYGRRIKVRPDGSHPFSNQRLALEFEVEPVFFAHMKEWGVRNIQQYLNTGNLLIPRGFTVLIQQMKKLRRDAAGKVLKRDDHCPDALLCGGCAFPFEQVHGGPSRDTGDVQVTSFGRNGEPFTYDEWQRQNAARAQEPTRFPIRQRED